MNNRGTTGSRNPLNRRIVAFVAVAAVVACACLIATDFSDETDAGKKIEFTLDDMEYEVISSEDLTVKVTGHKGSPTKLTIPENVTHLDKTYTVVKIGKEAFSGRLNLRDIQLPSTLKIIEDEAFSCCKNIKTVIIPDNVSKIGKDSFGDCKGLTDLTLPISLNAIVNSDFYAFWNCEKLQNITLTKGTGHGYDYNGYGNTPWKESNDSLKNLVVCEGVKSIGTYTFEGLDKLDNITLPSTLESIGDNAFKKCSSLKSLSLSDKLTSIGHGSFEGCKRLNDIKLPGTLESIGDRAFKKCSSLKSLSLSDKLTSIGHGSFEGCKGLNDIKLPGTLKSIGEYAFKNCSSLTDLTLPDGLTRIDHSAFEGCKSLKALEIPDSVTELGRASFKNCKELTRLTVPVSLDTVVKNDDPAFDGCKKIGTVTLTAGTGIGHKYGDNTHTPWHISKGPFKSLIVADGVKSIGENTFKDCGNLGNIQFCDGLESIGKDAFKGFRFFDSDGVTELSIDAGHLKGFNFSGKKGTMVKQTA